MKAVFIIAVFCICICFTAIASIFFKWGIEHLMAKLIAIPLLVLVITILIQLGKAIFNV